MVPGRPLVEPIPFKTLKEEDKREALEAVNLIAQKRNGKIKGWMCANSSRQRRFMNDDESFASPTASLKSIIRTLMIDAYEGRDIAIPNVPGEYLHASFPVDKKSY